MTYEINEKDIDSVLRFLKLTDPEHATPEMAMAILEHMQETLHNLSHENPDLLKQMYEEVKQKQAAKKAGSQTS